MTSFVAIYGVAIIALLGWIGWTLFQWRKLGEKASDAYKIAIERGDVSGQITLEQFTDIYEKSEAPRVDLYRALTALAALILFPPLVSFFSGLFGDLWFRSELAMGPYDLVQVFLDFLTILIVMGILVGGTYLVIRRYYAHRPPSLRSELRRLEKDAS